MEELITLIKDLKDFIVILTPIIVAFFTYHTNKKSKQDIQMEIEKSLREKHAETEQILQKINAELESQKQIAVWNSSLPTTDDYIKLAGTKRYGNISALTALSIALSEYIDANNLTIEELHEIRSLINRIEIPQNEDDLYPYEVMHLIHFNKLARRLDALIDSSDNIKR